MYINFTKHFLYTIHTHYLLHIIVHYTTTRSTYHAICNPCGLTNINSKRTEAADDPDDLVEIVTDDVNLLGRVSTPVLL